ncbi:Rv3212 family protein [Corynebacterium mastitidis]|uniref:Rv3212 family protein n=1 Tax=Corynebacterium mastitidis TaxID=161890 RepID=UPI00254D9BB6|nr:hypothetical protein [Corynebacterium mastitidis]MDK8450808.1 hypothetical protein [Corynebacterium mastitidis]
MSTKPLRRTRRDLVATAALSLLGVAAVGTVALTAPIRDAHPQPNTEEYAAPSSLEAAPAALTPAWSERISPLPGIAKPVTAAGLVFTHDAHTLRARDASGEQRWSYGRDDAEICSLGAAWGSVVVTYRTGAGCGDVVALNARTGEYKHTRSSDAEDVVAAVASNDRIGTLSPRRVELWRSDLVRTVEYGDVEAKQEPELQPHEECALTSALTRKEVLAVTETCPGSEGAWLRLQEATPESSREPTITGEVELPHPGARLVAVGETAAAVYVPGTTPRLVSYSAEGTQLASREVAASPLAEGGAPAGVFSPRTADLPTYITWFDGRRLYLLRPSDLSVVRVIEDAIGTGAAGADRLFYPTASGIAVASPDGERVERTLGVERPGEPDTVGLAVVGGSLVERRDGEIVGYAGA